MIQRQGGDHVQWSLWVCTIVFIFDFWLLRVFSYFLSRDSRTYISKFVTKTEAIFAVRSSSRLIFDLTTQCHVFISVLESDSLYVCLSNAYRRGKWYQRTFSLSNAYRRAKRRGMLLFSSTILTAINCSSWSICLERVPRCSSQDAKTITTPQSVLLGDGR